jgi:hypothetical protein
MHKWLMKFVGVATIGLIVAAIYAGSAFARLQASDSAAVAGGGTVSLAGGVYPKGTQVAPALGSSESGPAVHHPVAAASDSGSAWSNVWLGVAIGIGVLCIVGLVTVGIRRSKATPATA